MDYLKKKRQIRLRESDYCENTQELSVLFKEFVEDCELIEGLRAESIRGYKQSFKLFQKIFPNLTTDNLSSEVLKAFFKRIRTRERIVGRGHHKIGVKNSTIATYRSKLNRFFKWLKTEKYIKHNPLTDVPYPKVEYKDRKYLKKGEIEKILIAVSESTGLRDSLIGKRNKLIIYLGVYCGLRKGEFMNLQLSDIDFEGRAMTVRGETSKSKFSRVIPIKGKLIILLKDYLIERKRKGYETSYLLISSKDKNGHFTYNGLKHLVEKIRKVTKTDFHVHLLRHTFAVNMVSQGCDIAKLKQLMGHSDIRMTMAYLRCLPTKTMRNDIELLDIEEFV